MVSGNLQGGSHNVSQVDGVSDMAPAYWLCVWGGGVLENGQRPLLALMPDPLVSFCIPLVPFKLPPHAGAQREQV